MKCTRFRVLVTVVAAFGPFMAYVCRLNLSLIIEEMVVKVDDELDTNASLGGYGPSLARGLSAFAPEVSQEHAELAQRLPGIFSEEQSLASLSSGAWWLKTGAGRKSASPRNRKRPNRTRPAEAHAQLLSISFDAKPEAGAAARDSSQPTASGATTSTTTTPEATTQSAPKANDDGEGALLPWSKNNRNDLLGAFFLGYVLFQVPAGRAAEIFGPKLLFMVLGLGTGLASLLFPLACRATDSIWLAYSVRFLMGASQAGLFPAVYVLLCNWLPKSERSSWLAVPSAMGRIGTIAMNFAVPAVMQMATWEWVFYLSGAVTLAWGVAFLAIGSDSPATSAWLSQEERHYIEARMERPAATAAAGALAALEPSEKSVSSSRFSLNSTTPLEQQEQVVATNTKKPPINWLKMLRSRALLMLTLVMFTSEWSNMLLLVKLPGFLGPALRMDLDEVGLWSSILVAIYCVQYPLAGVLASRLEAAEVDYFSDSLRVRKLFELTAHLLQAGACLTIALVNNKSVVLTSLVVMMLGRSTVGGGQCLMPPELSKDYPGSVMAVANSFANIAGVVGPLVVTLLVDTPTEYNSWRNLWLLSAGIFLLGGALFCLLADNSPQNYCKKPKKSEKKVAELGGASKSPSRAQLVLPPYVPPPQMSAGGGDSQAGEPEIVRMDAFARVSSERPSKEKR